MGGVVPFLCLAVAGDAGAQPYWKWWPNYVSPSGDFNDPANWAGAQLPVTNDTVNITSVGTGWLGGNVDIHYVPIAGVPSLAEIDMSTSFNNTLNFFYQWPGADLTINHWLDLTTGVTFRHTNGTLTVDDLRVHDGAVYQMYLNSTPELYFGTAYISEDSRLELSSGLIESVGNTLELQATGGNPSIIQTGGTLKVSQLFMNYEEAGSYTMTGGTLTLPGNVGAGKLKIGTTDYETTSVASTGTSTFSLGGSGEINGDLVEITVGAYGRPGEMTQSGTSLADISRLYLGFQSTGSYEITSGTLDVDNRLAVGGDGVTAAGSGTFDQTGGAVVVRGPAGTPASLVVGGSGSSIPVSRYTYTGGTLEADILRVEDGSLFEQFNGVAVEADQIAVRGVYHFDSGSITTDAFDVFPGGAVTHRGDLTIADNGDPFDYEMMVNGGTHTFTIGSLVNHGDLAVTFGGGFEQNGAINHTVDGRVLIDGSSYRMNGQQFSAGSLELYAASDFSLESGVVVTPTALLQGCDFHFAGGNLDCPLVDVRIATLHFEADSVLDIDRLEMTSGAAGRVIIPSPRSIQLNGDLILGPGSGLDLEAGASFALANLEVGSGPTVDGQNWGNLDLAGDLVLLGSGSFFDQRGGHTIGQSLSVGAGGAYNHRGGTTQFADTLLGPDSSMLVLTGTCTTGPLELGPGSDLTVGSAVVQAGLVNDPLATGAGSSFTQTGGTFTASSLDLQNTEVIVEGGAFNVTGPGAIRGSTTVNNEAAANFGSLGISGDARWDNIAGSTLDVGGNLSVSTDGETLNFAGGTIDITGVFSVRQAPGDAGVADLSGSANLLVGSDFEVGEFGTPQETAWRQSGSSRTDVDGTTRIGASGLSGGPADRILLVDNSSLYSADLLVGEQGDGAMEQFGTSSLILDNALRIGAIAGKGEHFLNGGDISGSTMTIGEVNTASRYVQSAGSAAFTGAVTNAGTFELSGGTFSGASFTNTGDAYLAGNLVGPVTNQGTMRIGPEGVSANLALTGDFTNTSTRTLKVDITGAPGAAGNRDTLAVSGHATLAGIIDLTLPAALAPTVQIGDKWRILTCGSRSGTFFTRRIHAPGLPPYRYLDLEYGPTYVDVIVRQSALEFDTWIKDWDLDLADRTPEADPNHNGLANIIEFALGMNPSVSGPSPIKYAFNVDGYFMMTVPKPPYLPTGVGYGARFTSTLSGEWTRAEVVENSDTAFTALVRGTGWSPDRGFIQLVIEY